MSDQARIRRVSHGKAIHWLVALGLMAAFPACTELLVDPAPQSGVVLSLALPAPASPAATVESGDPGAASAGGTAAAFDQADAVRILLLRAGTTVAELERPFAPEGSETRIRVEVELEEDQETLQLQVALSWQGQVLFEAARSVTLRASESTEAEVVLQPVPAGVKVSESSVVLEALGEQAQLPGAVVFATDDPVPGLSLTWSTADTDVISVSSDGVVTALAPGEGQAIAAYEDFSATVTVAVTQAVTSVTVEPGQVEVPIDGTVQLAAALKDSNGHPIADEERTVTWSSSDPQIASVDGNGQVTAHETGEVAVTATAEGVSGLAAVTVVESGDPGQFSDPNLEAAIRDEIGKPEGEIFPSDLAQITSLTAINAGISELAGLEYLTNLTWLSLRNNEISDITPLEELTSLTSLNLRENQITDLTPLQGLTSLRDLNLQDNSISDLAPLEGLTALTTLSLGMNSISDITPLQGLTELTGLFLFRNSISDVTPIQGLTGLTRLDLWRNSISDVTPLQGLAQLTQLSLGGNSISDITPLQGLTGLTSLDLWENSFYDLAPLEGLTALTVLSLQDNSISDLAPLEGLTALTTLSLGRNSISDITPLQGLTELTHLSLHSNSISDVTPIQGLTGLTRLDLWRNSISDVTPLQGITGLTRLDLWENSISDVTPLQGLTGLTFLNLGSNSITDVQGLVDNEGLGPGDHVDLFSNPLGQEALCVQIPALQNRGVDVNFTGTCG